MFFRYFLYFFLFFAIFWYFQWFVTLRYVSRQAMYKQLELLYSKCTNRVQRGYHKHYDNKSWQYLVWTHNFRRVQPNLTTIKRRTVQMKRDGRLTFRWIANLVISEPIGNVGDRTFVKRRILGTDELISVVSWRIFWIPSFGDAAFADLHPASIAGMIVYRGGLVGVPAEQQ